MEFWELLLKMIKKIAQYQFKNPKLLTHALTHRSALNEQKHLESSYERLEFLGDAVLELIVSNHLYHQYPEKPEGDLTHLRAQAVQTKTLSEAAKRIKLNKHFILSSGEKKAQGQNNPSLLADCFEAVVGAIYLDQGLKKAQSFIQTHLLKHLKSILKTAQVTDYKSIFQEKTQAQSKLTPQYKLIKTTGPDHAKSFTVKVYLNNLPLATGKGKSKQQAQQQAAKFALEKKIKS